METTTLNKTALVLGATGGIGGEVARQLQAAGWAVRGLSRHTNPDADQDGIMLTPTPQIVWH